MTGKKTRLRFRITPPWAAVAGLLIAGSLTIWSCARPTTPPGGIPDRRPPVVVETFPDTFAVVEASRSEIRIRFNERISEQVQGGRLEDAVLVSPSSGDIEISHTRDALVIKLAGGLQPNVVYRITVLPVVQDMFRNTLREPFEFVFSTGPEFEPTVLAGVVEDRITGEPVSGAKVQAIPAGDAEDAPVYRSVAGEDGIYIFRYLPSDQYALRFFEDFNRNNEPDFRESQAEFGATLAATDTLFLPEIPILAPDTLPPVFGRIEAVDSVTLEISFDDFLDPFAPFDSAEVHLIRFVQDTTDIEAVATALQDTIRVARFLHPTEYRVYADSVSVAQAAASAAEQVQDPEAGVAQGAPPPVGAAAGQQEPGEESAEEEPEEPRPDRMVYGILDQSLQDSVVYRASGQGVRNINGLINLEPSEARVTWIRRQVPQVAPPGTAADTLTVQDTTVIPDTLSPPDTFTLPWARLRREPLKPIVRRR